MRVIGDMERSDHTYPEPDQICCHFGEYTVRGGYRGSATNSLIYNLQKDPSKKNSEEWKYKLQAIEKIGKLIGSNLKKDTPSRFTFVPAPTSKPPTDSGYDDRLMQVIEAIEPKVAVCPLLETVNVRKPAHKSTQRPGPDELEASMRICEDRKEDLQDSVQFILLDDLLVTGATFVACRRKLLECFPDANVYGLFVARRVLDVVHREFDSGDW